LPLDFFKGDAAVLWGLVAGGLVLSLAALAQSLVQFRRAQVQRAALVKCAGLLLAIALLAAFWSADFQVSASRGYRNPLGQEVSQAVRALPHIESKFSQSSRVSSRITVGDLEKVFPLSARAKRWLRGASLYLWWEPVKFSASGKPRIPLDGQVQIEFPNGKQCFWNCGRLGDGR
jgi:hypothetical protein